MKVNCQLSLHWIIPLLLRSVLPFQLSLTHPRHPRLQYPSTEIPASPPSLLPFGQGRPQPFVSAYFAPRKRLIPCARRLQIAICAGKSVTTPCRLFPISRRKHARGGTRRSGKRLFRRTWLVVAFTPVGRALSRTKAEREGEKQGSRVSRRSWTRCIYAR